MYDVHTRMKQGQIKTARAGSRTMMSDDVRRVRNLRQEAWVTGCEANIIGFMHVLCMCESLAELRTLVSLFSGTCTAHASTTSPANAQ